MISILHPSRGRPEKSKKTIDKWLGRSVLSDDIEVIVSCDYDDPTLQAYKMHHGDNIILNTNKSAVEAINTAAKWANGNVFIIVSDDTDCIDGWDAMPRNYGRTHKDFIIKTQDGTQPWIITNPIMDRTYYNRFGYIYHPDYKHMFCDTELTCVADLTGRKITSNILFKHNHYSVTKEPPDAISKRADSTWDHGEKLFLERYKRNFDLPPDQIKGKIQDNGMIRWLQRKVR